MGHPAVDKLRADGADDATLAAFEHRLAQLEQPGAGLLPGDELTPVDDPPRLEELPEPGPAILDHVAVIKLNGGLGTSMGLRGPKSLLQVKPGLSFLDVIVRQTRAAGVPLVLMDSFATREASLEAVGDDATDFLQSREPKLLADTHEPVEWPGNPALEWCPPGHGDVYPALIASGTLERLLDDGRHWAFISNADNLGARVDARIPAWAQGQGVPFVMEVVRGTPADRKGGHVALRDGRVLLRETAQVPDGDASFSDVERWRFYNTNDLWVDLRALKEQGPPPLPLIVNRKTVDPTDAQSPAVLQLESAMGAAIGAIEGARVVHVPRSRFAPVKTTADLLVVRSDAYAIGDDGAVVPQFDGAPPDVTLDPGYFKTIDQLDARTPNGPPSLKACTRLVVTGDVTFAGGEELIGDVELPA